MKPSPRGARNLWYRLQTCDNCKAKSGLDLVTRLFLSDLDDVGKLTDERSIEYWESVIVFLREWADALEEGNDESKRNIESSGDGK